MDTIASAKFLRLFNETNAGRPTRLGVFENLAGQMTDFWLEDGLPLVGIDCGRGDRSCDVQIRVGDMTHNIPRAERMTFHMDIAHERDGLDVLDINGEMTVLRFEK